MRTVLAFLAIGVVVNAIVALGLDWLANTEVQDVTIVSADEATRLLPGVPLNAPAETIAGWRCVCSGIDSVVRLVGEKRRAVEVDLQNNKVKFDLDSESMDNVLENGQLFLQTRAGWPMRSFVGRANVALTPGQIAKGAAARRVPLQINASIKGGHAPSFEQPAIEMPLGISTSQHIPRSKAAPNNTEESPTVDELPVTGHLAVGAEHVQPIPAAANGRWNAESVVQIFDRDHRVWPLALRPTWLGFLVNAAFYALLIWVAHTVAVLALRTVRAARGLCPRCTYDLRGASHGRCPECGHVLSQRGDEATRRRGDEATRRRRDDALAGDAERAR